MTTTKTGIIMVQVVDRSDGGGSGGGWVRLLLQEEEEGEEWAQLIKRPIS